ncbi:MAG: helix-turn-helix transcriptional regulator, partial [Spirochaetota bacterium]|nr:helix-turn-helix transcriptional regulator [Spirochaetota bacterium]
NNIKAKFYEMKQELNKYNSLENIKPIKDLAEVIRKERKKQKLTLRSLSELCGISYTSLVKVESGDISFNFKMLTQVLDTLGLKLWIG